MSVLSARLIDAAWGRPTVVKAVLWSLGIHVSAMAASCCWWSQPADSANLAGARNAVEVQAVLAAESPQRVVEVMMPVEREQARMQPLADDSPQPPVSTANPLRMETLAVSKARVASPVIREVRALDAMEVAMDFQFVTRTDLERPADVYRRTRPRPTESPSKLARREASVSMPQTSIAAEQMAGIDDKTPPDFQGNPPPEYPALAIAQGFEGTVLLRLHIAATGRVERVEIVTSSGHAILDRAAVEAVSRWQGRPAYRAGTPCATTELLPVRFRL